MKFARPLIRKFDWAEDDDNGLWGWRPKDMPDADPAIEYGVAHDACEHFDLRWDSMTCESEMQAFGTILYGRILGGWYFREGGAELEGRTANTFADEIVRFLVDGMEWAEHKPTKLLTDQHGDNEDYAEEWIAKLASETLRVMALDDSFGDLAHIEGEDLPARVADLMQWIRIGFKRARRRWEPRGGPGAFLDMFDAVSDALEVSNPSDDEYPLGATLTVRLWGEGIADVVVKERKDPYA